MPASAVFVPFSSSRPPHFLMFCLRTLVAPLLVTFVTAPTHAQLMESDSGDSPEVLLEADLREAVSLLEKKRFRMLAHDFLPASIAAQKEYRMNRPGGNAAGFAMSEATVAEFKAHLKAALEGEKFYNRNKTIVEITYVRKPVELAPEIDPDTVPVFGDRPSGKIKGFGSDLTEALASAVKMLESGQITEFIEHAFPLPELARISGGVSLRRYAERMTASPQMVEAMIRDLRQAVEGDIRVSRGVAAVQVPSLTDDAPDRTLKFELVEGHWRFYDNNRDERATHRRLATAKIGSLTIEERQGSMMLIRYRNNWRLNSMPTGMSVED